MAAVSLRGRRVRAYALGTSAILLGMMASSPAAADCVSDPMTGNATTNCTGTDDDGLIVTATVTAQVTVAPAAIVLPGEADAAITTRAANTTLTVAGLVDGQSKVGLFVTTRAPETVPCDPYAGASPVYCEPGSTQTYFPSASASVRLPTAGW